MGLTLDRGRYYFVMNVPKHLLGKVLGKSGQPVRQVRQALRTADLSVAKRKAFELEELKRSEWHMLELGEEALAHEKYAAAKKMAESHGFDYVPSDMLLQRTFEENLPRLLAAAAAMSEPTPPEVGEAILGGAQIALPPLRIVFEEFIDLTKTRHLRKSERQRHLWRLPRERAVSNFEKAVPKRVKAGIDRITREDALAFRAWWATRIETGETRAETANKDFGHLSQIIRQWSELKGHSDLENPFARLRFDKAIDPLVTRPPFSQQWIKDRLLAPCALDGLNVEARDAFLVLINTGLRPSEVLSCPLEDFCLDNPIPFLRVAPHGRELKQRHTAREIPLLGVSLAAAQRIVARGGIQRYQHKATSWSNLVNKYLEINELKETPAHTAYCLRHYVEDALLIAGIDDRVRADILGHKYKRPVYGEGGGLALRRDALKEIAL
ncbi:MAG: tyrosine-type recombinase/integrase [Pseudomonadota bacterium]